MNVHTPEMIFYLLVLGHGILVLRATLPILGYPGAPVETSPKTVPFSVIVCAHNEISNLRRSIPALLTQNYPEFEVVVALDRCTDQSLDYLKSISDPRLKVLTIARTPAAFSGKKHALTQAIRQARHEWLLLTDADCIPASPGWIQTFSMHTRTPAELILGLSPYFSEPTLISQLTDYETFQTAVHYTSAALQNQPYMGVGRNISYRKSAFLKSNGFYPFEAVIGGDDDLMVQKLATAQNTRMNLCKESLTYSSPKRRWSEYSRQKHRHLSVGKHYRSNFKTAHTIRLSIHAFLWLSFLYLMGSSATPIRIIVVFGALVVLKGFFFKKISDKTGMPFRWQTYPVWDFVYAVFLPLIGFRAIVDRNIRWK